MRRELVSWPSTPDARTKPDCSRTIPDNPGRSRTLIQLSCAVRVPIGVPCPLDQTNKPVPRCKYGRRFGMAATVPESRAARPQLAWAKHRWRCLVFPTRTRAAKTSPYPSATTSACVGPRIHAPAPPTGIPAAIIVIVIVLVDTVLILAGFSIEAAACAVISAGLAAAEVIARLAGIAARCGSLAARSA